MQAQLPPFPVSDQRLRELETAVNGCKTDKINTLVMEASREAFESEFEIFREELESNGIRELEELKGDYMIQNTGNT